MMILLIRHRVQYHEVLYGAQIYVMAILANILTTEEEIMLYVYLKIMIK